jgi:hypothetical protein
MKLGIKNKNLQKLISWIESSIFRDRTFRVNSANESPHPIPVLVSGQRQSESVLVSPDFDLDDLAG